MGGSSCFTSLHRSHPFLSIPIPTAGLGSFSPSCKLRTSFKITFGGAVVRVDTFGQPRIDSFLGSHVAQSPLFFKHHAGHHVSNVVRYSFRSLTIDSENMSVCHMPIYANVIQSACTHIRFHLISMQYLGSPFHQKIGCVNLT